MDDRVRLAELVCARLCHDLSGLLGSLIGTLDLLAEDGEASEAATIAHESAAALGHRVRLLRAAWGDGAEPLDLARLTGLAAGLANRRARLDLSALPAATVFRPAMGRLVLNLLLLAGDSLPRGGQLRLDGSAEDLTLHLTGPNAAWPPGLAGMLADVTTCWPALTEPRAVLAPLTVLLAYQDGLRLTLLPQDDPAAAPPSLRLRAI